MELRRRHSNENRGDKNDFTIHCVISPDRDDDSDDSEVNTIGMRSLASRDAFALANMARRDGALRPPGNALARLLQETSNTISTTSNVPFGICAEFRTTSDDGPSKEIRKDVSTQFIKKLFSISKIDDERLRGFLSQTLQQSAIRTEEKAIVINEINGGEGAGMATKSTVIRWFERSKANFGFKHMPRSSQPSVLVESDLQAVLDAEPPSDTRDLAEELGVSQRTVSTSCIFTSSMRSTAKILISLI
ncbi:hypothetical protein KIN20_010124 [Parelaphostrongylus tenuis]|uniref:Mos1 transposase HTH domain-containing protein n=1 Tax=Parelaphostrongylus tenuis TaxID=148309 RepID=A0AAD5QLN1_PARTN|nr:hypothetical protein KIN20_010124 [Parelaphostrongylus tenuis]